MSRYALTLIFSTLVLSACSREEPVAPVEPVPEPVEAVQVEEPVINTDIDDDSAFEAALGEVSGQDEAGFNEVVDDIDADVVVAAAPGEKLAQALQSEENREEVLASEVRQAAREEVMSSDTPSGLEIRPFSDELYAQVEGVRPAVIYFTSSDCAVCIDWEAGLRADAEAYADMNALVLLADINAQADLAAEMRVTEAGQGMMLTGMGEMMGPRPTDRLTPEELSFIFQ